MIICIDCVENPTFSASQYDKHPNLFPIGECSKCHSRAPLVDGYIQQPGKHFDTLGKELHVGDTIAYSVAAGRSSGKMVIGFIYKINPRTICVEVETVDWDSGFNQRVIQKVKSHFNYHPSKCLKLDNTII